MNRCHYGGGFFLVTWGKFFKEVVMSQKWVDRRHYKPDEGKTASLFKGKKSPDLLELDRDKRVQLAFLGKDSDGEDGKQMPLIPYGNTGVTNDK